MKWNKSEEDLIKLLHKANKHHPNIKLDYQIGKTLPFLDVLLKNDNGNLLTSVYHKPAAKPYVVPFISDHSRHVFVNIIKTSILPTKVESKNVESKKIERKISKDKNIEE
jgi:hypothetical protein